VNALLDLYRRVRETYPSITQQADKVHLYLWDELKPELAHAWFESLAAALNQQMRDGVGYETHKALFECLSTSLQHAPDDVYACIDVAFVENLFWEVPTDKAAPYWSAMPLELKKLYLEFHRREP